MARKKAQAEAGEDLSAWFEQSRPKLRPNDDT